MIEDSVRTSPIGPIDPQCDELESLRNFRFAADQHAIVSIADAGGRIVEANERFLQISGYSRAELLGQDHRLLNSGHHPQCFFAKLWQTIAAGNVWNGILRNRRKDGDFYWVATTIVPIRGSDGRPSRYISIRTDISGQVEAEEELRKTSAALEHLVAQRTEQLGEAQQQLLQTEKLASIGQLAAGIAHEINNPIGYVHSNLGSLKIYLTNLFRILDAYAGVEPALPAGARGMAELVRLKNELDLDFLRQDLPALMEESKEGLERVRKIVQDLKDFSRVDSSQEWQWADLHRGLDSTLNVINNEIKYKADVIKEYGELPEVECLPSQLNQVFMNLLVNAAHAIGADQRGTITLRSGCAGEQVWVEVTDSGSGIAPEHLKRIFDPFFTTKPVGKGTGLGLAISYGIVERHGGKLAAFNHAYGGAVFTLLLPLA